MQKLRYGAMSKAIALGVGAFLVLQQFLPETLFKSRRVTYETYFAAPDVALPAFAAAITENPQDFMTYYRRGMYLLSRSQFTAALADLDQAIALSPTPLTLEALGEQANNNRDAATILFNRVVLVRIARADLLARMDRPVEALRDLDHAIAIDNRKTAFFYSRGVVRAGLGQYDGAIADFDRILARRSNTTWFVGRGVAKFFKGDFTSAALDFKEAARRAPADEDVQTWLTRASQQASASNSLTDVRPTTLELSQQ